MITVVFSLTIVLTLGYVFLILLIYRGLFFLKPGNNSIQYDVSVVVAARNEQENIGRLLQALINQSYPADKYQIIIVDDRSADRTAEIVNYYKKKYSNIRSIPIKALPEGSRVPMRVPCLTIVNTLPEFYWLTNFFESIMSAVIWQPITSATIAHEYRKILDKYAEETGMLKEFVQWQGHDFSFRGMSSLESAILSGMGHLLSFTGTDTIPAIDAMEQYYNADAEKELIGGSVAATEHSVMCAGAKDGEIETFKRLVTEVYPSGIVSIVSDTWDLWKVCTEYLPILKEDIF